MYFVDRKTIEEKLSLMEQYLQILSQKNEWQTAEDKLALERIVHIVVESIIDVGNSLIDGFVMRDPGSYEDIIDILLDEKVINEEDAGSYKKIVALRKMVVRDYTKVEHDLLVKLFKEHDKALKKFPPYVNQYLKNELGHVTAFIPD